MAEHSRRTCTIPSCPTCRQISRTTLAFLFNRQAMLAGDDKQRADPVLWADVQTSYHDMRVALNLVCGVPLEQIDPTTGHRLAAA